MWHRIMLRKKRVANENYVILCTHLEVDNALFLEDNNVSVNFMMLGLNRAKFT